MLLLPFLDHLEWSGTYPRTRFGNMHDKGTFICGSIKGTYTYIRVAWKKGHVVGVLRCVCSSLINLWGGLVIKDTPSCRQDPLSICLADWIFLCIFSEGRLHIFLGKLMEILGERRGFLYWHLIIFFLIFAPKIEMFNYNVAKLHFFIWI